MRSRRNDARRNREEILRVADAAFTDGLSFVPLGEIARRAGLGRATVYRHFPDRHALGVAVADEYFTALRRVVDAPASERRSFRTILRWVMSTQVTRGPLAALIRELPPQEQQHHVSQLIGILTPPFLDAQREGKLRPDAKPEDLILLFTMLNAAVAAEPVDDDHAAAMKRLVGLLLDGLFPAPVDPSAR